VKKGKIGPISAPHDGRPLNADVIQDGWPISNTAIGRQDIDIDTAPEAARRREEKRYVLGDREKQDDPSQGTIDEKCNDGRQAWRDGDNIIVEDEEGEIIKMISSPRLSRSVEQKAGEEGDGFGGLLRRMWSGQREGNHRSARQPSRDLEAAIPEVGEGDVERRSSGSSRASGIRHDPPNPLSVPVVVIDEDSRQMDHVSEFTQRRARKQREEETEIERRRREAALGMNDDVDQDEEEEDQESIRSTSRDKGKQPISQPTSDVGEVENASASENRSQNPSSDSGRPESSSSAQPLAPPAAVRTRGIHFGDISIQGTQSFTLDEGPPPMGFKIHHRTGSSGSGRVRWSK
jgi:Alkali metal cation/H+ antiporter Nha1 C terminus